MTMNINTKTYCCEAASFKANDDGEVIVTLIGDFSTPEKMTGEEVVSIVNDPLFLDLLCAGYQCAPFGTPLWRAFERLRSNGGEAIVRFEQPEIMVAA